MKRKASHRFNSRFRPPFCLPCPLQLPTTKDFGTFPGLGHFTRNPQFRLPAALRLRRGRTSRTAKKQQTQLSFANTAYGFVLSLLPTPFLTSVWAEREEAEQELGRVWGKMWPRKNNFTG